MERLSEILVGIDPARLHCGPAGRSAQPDEDRLAYTGDPLDGVREKPGLCEPLEKRPEFVGVRNDVAGLVNCYPSASIPFDEIALHELNTTS